MRFYALFFSNERKIRRSAEDTKVSVTLYRICSFRDLHAFSAYCYGFISLWYVPLTKSSRLTCIPISHRDVSFGGRIQSGITSLLSTYIGLSLHLLDFNRRNCMLCLRAMDIALSIWCSLCPNGMNCHMILWWDLAPSSIALNDWWKFCPIRCSWHVLLSSPSIPNVQCMGLGMANACFQNDFFLPEPLVCILQCLFKSDASCRYLMNCGW